MDFATMKITEIVKLPGVADLPFKVRGLFALALQAESKGEHAKADAKLSEAIAAEETER